MVFSPAEETGSRIWRKKAKKSSFFLTEIQPICIIEGSRHGKRSHFFGEESRSMSFQSYTFFFALLPVSVAGWWLLNWRGHGRLAQGFLLVVSLAFYGKGNLAFLPLLLGGVFCLTFWLVRQWEPCPGPENLCWCWVCWAT